MSDSRSVPRRRRAVTPGRQSTVPGPAATALAADVARRYYIDGATKSEIAGELGLSRFKVARVLDQARTSGLVRIELHYEGESIWTCPSACAAATGSAAAW